MIAGLALITLALVILAGLYDGADAAAGTFILSSVVWMIGGGIYLCVAT